MLDYNINEILINDTLELENQELQLRKDGFLRHVNLLVILCTEVRELHTFYAYIYIFG